MTVVVRGGLAYRGGEPRSRAADTMGAGSMAELDSHFCPTCGQSFAEGHQRCPVDQTDLVDLTEIEDPMIGRTISDRFTIKALLGAGGMGSVYRAVQHSVGRDVAIKVIRGEYLHGASAVKRFVREAQLTSQIAHPNTVTIFDFGQTADGLLFLAMELLPGVSLRTHLRTSGRLPVARALGIAAAGRIHGQLHAPATTSFTATPPMRSGGRSTSASVAHAFDFLAFSLPPVSLS